MPFEGIIASGFARVGRLELGCYHAEFLEGPESAFRLGFRGYLLERSVLLFLRRLKGGEGGKG